MKQRLAAWGDTALLALGLLVVNVTMHGSIWGDGSARANFVRTLLTTHTLTSERYSGIGPIFALPLAAIDRLVGDPGAAEGWLGRYNIFLVTLFLPLLAHALTPLFTAARAKATVLLVLGGSMLPFHMLTFYGEMFSAVTIAIGIAWVAQGRSTLGWVFCAVGAANTMSLVPGLGLVALYFAFQERRLHPLLAPVLATALVLLEAYVRRGSPFDQGYDNDGASAPSMFGSGKPGFSYPFLAGFFEQLFTFGRGIMFFAPGLWLALRGLPRTGRPVYAAWLLAVLGAILVYAKWWAWNGAIYHGPRFLLLAVFPASALLAAALRPEDEEQPGWLAPVTLVLLAFSAWGAIVSATQHYFLSLDKNPVCHLPGDLCINAFRFAPLYAPTWNWHPLDWRGWSFVIWVILTTLWLGAPVAQRSAQTFKVLFARARAHVWPVNEWRF